MDKTSESFTVGAIALLYTKADLTFQIIFRDRQITTICIALTEQANVFYFSPPAEIQYRFQDTTRVIIKMEKPEWEDEFKREIETYQRLRECQGQYIPIFYEEVEVRRGDESITRRAILLSYLDGVTLRDSTNSPIERQELELRIQEALQATSAYGIKHEDLTVANVFWMENKAMIIDWESVGDIREENKEEEMASYTSQSTLSFLRVYAHYLRRKHVPYRKYGYGTIIRGWCE